MLTKALILALLPTVFGHIGLWHPSVFDFDGDGYTLVTPMSGLSFSNWWFHGNLAKKPTGSPLVLPAGETVTVELACNKAYTSYGSEGDGKTACPPNIGSYHAGDPIDDSQILGCGLAIAYNDNADNVKPADFTIFSVNTNCVRDLKTSFQVPPKMPACPNGKCTCAWFWQGQASQNEMYMTGFYCNVEGVTSTAAVGPGVAPKYCSGSASSCVSGPKQPMYWANDNSNIVYSGDYYQKPSYNSAWGFSNGPQNDIFVSTTPTTTLITTTRSSTTSAATTIITCAWQGHCAGSACSDDNDCSDVLTCQSGKCA